MVSKKGKTAKGLPNMQTTGLVKVNSKRQIRHSREKRFAELMASKGIEILYEPMRFKLPAPYGTYTPDFYIPSEVGGKFIEKQVKGYVDLLLYDAVRRIAYKEHISMSEVVRRSLEQYIQEKP